MSSNKRLIGTTVTSGSETPVYHASVNPIKAPVALPNPVYKAPKYTAPEHLSAKQYASGVVGMDPNRLDPAYLERLFGGAARAELNQGLRGFEQARNTYSQGLAQTQNSYIEAVRAANAGAIQSGVSRGTIAAQQLSAMMGLQQQSVGGLTELANQEQWLYSEYGRALSQGMIDAELESFDRTKDMATLSQDKYAQELQAIIQKYGVDVDAAVAIFNAEHNWRATKYNADTNLYGIGVQNSFGKNVSQTSREYDNRPQSDRDLENYRYLAELFSSGNFTEQQKADMYKKYGLAPPTGATTSEASKHAPWDASDTNVLKDFSNSGGPGDQTGFKHKKAPTYSSAQMKITSEKLFEAASSGEYNASERAVLSSAAEIVKDYSEKAPNNRKLEFTSDHQKVLKKAQNILAPSP